MGSRVAGNARPVETEGCEQRRCTGRPGQAASLEAVAPHMHACEGVKRLNSYLCARPCQAPILVLGEPHEGAGNSTPRYMTAHAALAAGQNPAYRCSEMNQKRVANSHSLLRMSNPTNLFIGAAK